MTTEIPKPAEIRKTKGYLWRRIGSKWPFLIWLGMALLTYQLYQRGVRFERMNGFVFAETEIIAPLEDGIIAEMSVTESGDLVDAGEVVVAMDPRLAQGEFDEREQELRFEKIEQARKFGAMKTELINDIAVLTSEEKTNRSTLEILEKNLEILRDRASKNLIPPSDVRDAELEIATIAATLDSYAPRLKAFQAAQKTNDQLLKDLEEYQKTDPASLELLRDQIELKKLTSANGGVVSKIHYRAGSVVRGGYPIVEILDLKSRGARGFIPEENADKVEVGKTVYISPTGKAGAKLYPGKITFISPLITSTPDVGSSVSGRMIKGREITCSFDNSAEVDLLPGQSVSIHLGKPGGFKLFSFGADK